MSPVLSAEGAPINWINYKTGEKDIYFRMNADHQTASIATEIRGKDACLRGLYLEQFQQLQAMLQDAVGEEWIWLPHTQDEFGHGVSRIYTEIAAVSIFKKEDWPQLISFFKARIIALDEFWSTARYVFETLR